MTSKQTSLLQCETPAASTCLLMIHMHCMFQIIASSIDHKIHYFLQSFRAHSSESNTTTKRQFISVMWRNIIANIVLFSTWLLFFFNIMSFNNNSITQSCESLTSTAFSLSDCNSWEWRLDRELLWLVHSERSLSNSLVFSDRVCNRKTYVKILFLFKAFWL